MRTINFETIIQEAWDTYGSSKRILSIEDISAKVSTNHVYRVALSNNRSIIAKLSYFGKYDHFKEDHHIINTLSNNLLYPYENFIAKSLVKNNEVFTYRFKRYMLDAWVVFYNPIRTDHKLPRRLNEEQIGILGEQLADFHTACIDVVDELPPSTKTLKYDIKHLLEITETAQGKFELRGYIDEIKKQCNLFLENCEKLDYESFTKIPVFIDWNIGNFSVNKETQFFSRWDYDWFRTSSRVMDFYFLSRVVSDIGDRTVFSYVSTTFMEERFMIFLKRYHQVNPLTENEIHFMKEAYRFFILNYVVKDGRYFFHEIYAHRLLQEAFNVYFPQIDKIDTNKILKALND